jgi:hypothetical protein
MHESQLSRRPKRHPGAQLEEKLTIVIVIHEAGFARQPAFSGCFRGAPYIERQKLGLLRDPAANIQTTVMSPKSYQPSL